MFCRNVDSFFLFNTENYMIFPKSPKSNLTNIYNNIIDLTHYCKSKRKINHILPANQVVIENTKFSMQTVLLFKFFFRITASKWYRPYMAYSVNFSSTGHISTLEDTSFQLRIPPQIIVMQRHRNRYMYQFDSISSTLVNLYFYILFNKMQLQR